MEQFLKLKTPYVSEEDQQAVKPITYQVHNKQYIYIEDIIKIESSDNNLTLYFSNNLKIERKYNDNKNKLNEKVIRVKKNEDIVISGIGFIKVTKNETIKISTKNDYLNIALNVIIIVDIL